MKLPDFKPPLYLIKHHVDSIDESLVKNNVKDCAHEGRGGRDGSISEMSL